MKRSIVVVGLGQLGLSYARGFLKLGHPVVPLRRGDQLAANLESISETQLLILVAVGEDDLQPALANLNAALTQVGKSAEYIFLQNELRPGQWTSSCDDPTVSIVWFEQKANRLAHEVRASLHYGPNAELCDKALQVLNLKSECCGLGLDASQQTRPALCEALVLKNLYILVLNLGGLRGAGTALELLEQDESFFMALFKEIFQLELALFTEAVPELRLDRNSLLEQLKAAIHDDPTHGCSGRSAPRRLERCCAHAKRLSLNLPLIEELALEHL